MAGTHVPDVESRCIGFAAACVVSFLVIFELIFYFAYIAPVVESGNIRRTAKRVSDDLVHENLEMFQRPDCAALAAAIRAVTLPPSSESPTGKNVRLVGLAALACGIILGALFFYWRLRVRPYVRFPSRMLAKILGPIAIAFVLYDFLYFTLFVERWDTISGDEFLWQVVRTESPGR